MASPSNATEAVSRASSGDSIASPPTWRFGRWNWRIPSEDRSRFSITGTQDITTGVRVASDTKRAETPGLQPTRSPASRAAPSAERTVGWPFFPLDHSRLSSGGPGQLELGSFGFWVTAPPSERELCVDGTRDTGLVRILLAGGERFEPVSRTP